MNINVVSKLRSAGFSDEEIGSYLSKAGFSRQEISSYMGRQPERVSAVKELGRGFMEGLMSTPETIGTIAKIAGAKKAGKAIEDFSKSVSDDYRMPAGLQGSVVKDPSLLAEPAWWAHSIGQVAGSVVGPVGAGGTAAKTAMAVLNRVIRNPKTVAKAAKYIGIGTAGAFGGTMEGSQTYNQVLEETGDEKKALRSGTLMAIGSAVLNSSSFGNMLTPKVKSKLLHVVTSSIMEGETEQLEEPWEALVTGKPEEAVQRWIDGFNVLLPSMVVGGLGGGAGLMSTSGSKDAVFSKDERDEINGALSSALKDEAIPNVLRNVQAGMEAVRPVQGEGFTMSPKRETVTRPKKNYPVVPYEGPEYQTQPGEMEGEVQVEYRPLFSKSGKPYKSFPAAQRVAAKTGGVVVQVEGGYAVQDRPKTITRDAEIVGDIPGAVQPQVKAGAKTIPILQQPIREMDMQSEATRLGLEYVGVQEGGKVPLHLFTDPQNGSTFTVPEGESVDAALKGNRERFAPKTPVGETGDATTQPKAEEATGGGKEQAAGALGREKEPWRLNRDEAIKKGKRVAVPSDREADTSTAEIAFAGKQDGYIYRGTETESELSFILKSGKIESASETAKRLGKTEHEGITFFSDRPHIASSYIQRDGYLFEIDKSKVGQPISDLGGGELGVSGSVPISAINRIIRVGRDDKGVFAVDVTPEILKYYPELTKKPHDNIPDVSVQKKVTVDQKAPEIEPQPPATESATPHGWVEIKGKQRPFTTYREILRGKNKGMYRVSVGGKSYLVDKGKVRKWPGTEEVKTEERPARTDQIGDQYKAQQKAVQEPIKETDTFTDGMLPMQAKRVNDALDRSIRHNGKLTTRRAMVKALVDDGATIVEKNGERRLQRPNGNFLIEKDISKTAMDYADHLIKQKSRKQAIDKEVADLNIQVDAQKDLTRESLKKDHPDWSAQRVEDELAKTVRAGEEAGVSEANERIGKPAVKRSLFEKKAVGAETAPSTAKHEPVSQKPKPEKKTPDLTATFPSSYSKTPREVLGKNSLWKVVSKDGKVVETEYAAHPHILIVMDKKDRDAIGYQGKTPQGRDAVVSKEVVDSLLESVKKPGTEVKTIEIAKYAERDDLGILSDGNIEVAVNPNLIGMVKRQHPNATFYLNGPERPIAAFDGKEWKALIMPLSGTDFESVRKNAETIIEVPASAKVGKASSPPRPQGTTVPKKQNVITGTIREKVDEAIKKAPEIDSDDLLRLDEIRDFKPSKWESYDAGKKRVAEDREFYDSLKKKYGTIEITSPTGQGWKYNIINTKHHLGNFKKQIEKLEKGKEGIALFRKKAKAEKAVTEQKKRGGKTLFRKKPADPFAAFAKEKEEKYKDILAAEAEDIGLDMQDVYDKIINYDMRPKDLDAYLNGIDKGIKPRVVTNVKTIIADTIGDMIGTYRYESTEEGHAIEGYIDRLLSVVRKHDVSTAGVQDTTTGKAEGAAKAGQVPESGRVAPKQRTLFRTKKSSPNTQDQEYLDAVNRGDTEAAQHMVDEAARKAGRAQGLPLQSIQQAIDPITSKWKNAPAIKVVQSTSELPGAIRKQIGEGDVVAGAFHDDTVYIVADHTDNAQDAQKTILHEVIAHWGLRKTFGPDLDTLLRRIYRNMDRSTLKDIADRYGYDLTNREDQLYAVEEYMASVAEMNKKPPVWNRLVAWVRQRLRSMGFTVDMSWNDVDMMIADALGKARKYVEGGKSPAEDVTTRAMFRKKSLFDKRESGKNEPVTSKKGPGEKPTEATSKPDGGITVVPIEYDRMGDTAWYKIPIEHIIPETDKPTFEVKINNNGHVQVISNMYNYEPELRDKIKDAVQEQFGKLLRKKMGLSDDEYWRFTDNPKEIDLIKKKTLNPSKNYAEGKAEKGLSVADHVGYGGTTNFKYGYRVRGKVIGSGSDGEPVLDLSTLQISGKIRKKTDIITEERKAKDDLLEEKGWSRLQEYAAITYPEVIKSEDFYKHPQVKSSFNPSRPSEKGGSVKFRVKSIFQSKGIGEPPKKNKASLFARNVARAIQVRPREILKKEAPQSSKEPIRKYEQTISDERRFAGNWMSEFDQSIEGLSHADKKWIRENFKDAYENGVRMPNPRIQRFMQAWDKIQNEIGDKAIDLGIQEKYRTSEYVVKKGTRSVRVFDTKKEAETFIKNAKNPEGLEMTSRDAVKVRPFTKIKNYFPHTLTPEAREALRTQRGEVFDALQEKAHTEGFDLAPYMEDVDIKNMVRRNANLENARQARLPNFVDTSTGRVQILETNPFKVLPNVIEGASRRLAFAKNWGPKPGEALKMHEEIRNSITRESGSDNAFVWDYLWQDMQGRTLDEFFEGMSGDIKGFLYSAEAISRGLMLSSAQISNIITGPLPGMVKFGAWNMTKAGARLISQKLAKRLGVPMPETEALLEQFRREGGWSKETMKVTGETEDIGKSVAGIADTFLKKTGMEAANRFLNKMSNFASHYALEDAIEGLRKPRLGTFRKAWGMDPKGLKEFLKREGEWTDSDIDRIIKNGLTEEDHARFIQKSSTNTNVFMERANTRPSFMKNGFWRRVFSYTSYYRMMGSVVADTMKYAKEGNYRPLITLLLAAPVLGMAEKLLKEYLKGVILQADEKKDEALTFAGQLLDAIAGAGALGFPGAMLSNLKWWTKRGGAPLTFPQAEWWGKVTYGMYNAVVKGLEESPGEGAKQAYYTTIKNVPIFREIDNMLGGPYTQSLEKYRHGGHRQRRSRSHRRTSR